jgi:plasmid stabilization system protein ParE
MTIKILPAARERLLGIWQYTSETWGDEQADNYVSGLVESLEHLANRRTLWRPLGERRFRGIFCTRYRHHYIFFRELPEAALAVISILHESMDLPNRLKEDAESE